MQKSLLLLLPLLGLRNHLIFFPWTDAHSYMLSAPRGYARQPENTSTHFEVGFGWLLCLSIVLLIGGCSSENVSGTIPAPTAVPNTDPITLAKDTAPAQQPSHNAPVPVPPSTNSVDRGFAPQDLHFVNAASDRGLDFTYQNGARGNLLMVESIGGGAGWLDFNHDELPDVYFTQGGIPDTSNSIDRPPDLLFRQATDGTFHNVASSAGTGDLGYGQGVAVGDFDEDGFDDIFVCNVGQNKFYRNAGDGTFVDWTSAIPPIDPRWSSSAAWADLDQDGFLDLYVCNYLQYDPQHPLECLKDGLPALCHPRQLPHWPDECYRNSGDGSFERVTDQWGLKGPGNKALGVAVADFTDDGRPDIYVANDTTANFLFVAQPNGGFADEALGRGVALNGAGDAQASMGVAVADYDGNGLPDILLSHFTGESNTLYQNQGEFGMQDVSSATSIRKLSFPKLGFGIVMQDFNSDGFMDCLVANGHIDERNADFDGYEQNPQLLSFDGSKWQDVSSTAGPYFANKYVGRGIATADVDNDGDLDAVIVHQNKPAALLMNESNRGHWLQLRFTGTKSNRAGIGCKVTVRHKEQIQVAQLVGGSSFAASHQPALVFGLGLQSEPVDVEIHWPSGIIQKLQSVAVDQILRVKESETVH